MRKVFSVDDHNSKLVAAINHFDGACPCLKPGAAAHVDSPDWFRKECREAVAMVTQIYGTELANVIRAVVSRFHSAECSKILGRVNPSLMLARTRASMASLAKDDAPPVPSKFSDRAAALAQIDISDRMEVCSTHEELPPVPVDITREEFNAKFPVLHEGHDCVSEGC